MGMHASWVGTLRFLQNVPKMTEMLIAHYPERHDHRKRKGIGISLVNVQGVQI